MTCRHHGVQLPRRKPRDTQRSFLVEIALRLLPVFVVPLPVVVAPLLPWLQPPPICFGALQAALLSWDVGWRCCF